MTVLRCAPGDIAVIVAGADEDGTFVDVLERCIDHPVTGQPAWHCRVHAPMEGYKATTLFGRVWTKNVKVQPGARVSICDIWLQPIRPHAAPVAEPAPPVKVEA